MRVAAGLGATLVLLLAACGGGGSSGPPPDQPAGPATTDHASPTVMEK